jgi:hypothetical protein
MSNTTSGLFGGLKDAFVGGKRPYMKPGTYVVRVIKAQYYVTRNKGDAFILEFEVVKSNYEEQLAMIVRGLNGQPPNIEELNKKLPNRVGETCSWYQSLKDKAVGFGALKGFCAAIMGQNPEDPVFKDKVETLMDAIVQQNALAGYYLPLETVMILTKEKKDFTLHNWGLALEQGQAV